MFALRIEHFLYIQPVN